VVRERLVSGQRQVSVAVRERQHRLARRLARVGARVHIHAHVLQGAGRRVVEREIVDLATQRRLFVLSLAHAHAELLVGVLPVPHVSQVLVNLARPEELVRRRECRDRSAFAFGDEHAVLRLQRHDRVVLDAAELVLLGAVTGIPPHHPRQHVGRKTLQAGVVLVGDELFVGLRDRIHPDQVGTAIHGELQAARKNPHRQPGEIHLEPRAIGLHAAAGDVERRIGTANLLGRARQRRILGAAHARHFERRVMECEPPVLGHHFRRQRDARGRQRPDMVARHPAEPADDVVLRQQVLPQRRPLPALFAHREVTNDRLGPVDGVARAQLASRLPGPRDDEQLLLHRRGQASTRLVLRRVALEPVGGQRRRLRGEHRDRQRTRRDARSDRHSRGHMRCPPGRCTGIRQLRGCYHARRRLRGLRDVVISVPPRGRHRLRAASCGAARASASGGPRLTPS